MSFSREDVISGDRIKSSLSRLALATLLLAGAASAAANVLVVRSSGPSAEAYPPGRSLPDNRRISLRSGDTIVILHASGTRTFRGPGRFNPSVAPRANTRPVVAANYRPRVASVRNAGYVPGNEADIWQADIGHSGTHCLAHSGGPELWRADSSQPLSVTLTGPDGTSRSVSWPAGAAVAAWPAEIAVAEGGEYRLVQPGVAVPTTVRFRRLASRPADIPAVAAALIEAGCQEQLDLLVDTIDQR